MAKPFDYDSLNPDDMKTLDDAIDEAVVAMEKIEHQKQQITDIADMIKIEMEMSPADFKKQVAERHANKCTNQIEKIMKVVDLEERMKSRKQSRS